MLALVINLFKRKIEKEYLITNTNVYISSDSGQLFNRIQISLESIGLKEIEINPIQFNYLPQGDVLDELIEQNEKYEKQMKMIEKANKIASKENIETINIDRNNIHSYLVELNSELQKYSIQER